METFTLPGRQLIDIAKILYLESDSNYTFIFLNDGSKILSSTSLGKLALRLKSNLFLRPNRSILINARFIKKRTHESLILYNDDVIRISRRRQKYFPVLALESTILDREHFESGT